MNKLEKKVEKETMLMTLDIFTDFEFCHPTFAGVRFIVLDDSKISDKLHQKQDGLKLVMNASTGEVSYYDKKLFTKNHNTLLLVDKQMLSGR